MKKIILTGGGTAGHITPNLALLPELKKIGFEAEYIGSYRGMEKELIEKEGIPYHGIASGKLRRYFDLKNFSDPFNVIKGYFEAKKLLKSYKPDVLFSKGGFVSVPVVWAAKSLKIPVITHESDMTPGLANKLSFGAASKVCCNFPETVKYLPADKAVLSGSPIRRELLSGDKDEARRLTGFNDDKPVLLIIGGSLGSVIINNAVRSILPKLLKKFNIIHICGKGNPDSSLNETAGYIQYEYVSGELCHLYALADIVISRAGANVICELLALKKPNLLIPLSARASRGDQVLNARSFEKQGFSYVLEEENLNDDTLYEMINKVYDNKNTLIENMSASDQSNGVDVIISLIQQLA